MDTVAQPGVVELLELAGARLRGKGRFDCPDCGGRRTVSIRGPHKDTFRCHHMGCRFRGGVGTLKKRLGIQREWLPKDEYVCRQRMLERANEAARMLYSIVHQRQLELREGLHILGHLESLAHDAGPSEETWKLLADVYSRRPGIEQQLDALESGDPGLIFDCLSERRI